MNINSFITCPRCARMHEGRVEICGTCGFEHVKIETVTVGTDDIELPVDSEEATQEVGEITPPDPTHG